MAAYNSHSRQHCVILVMISEILSFLYVSVYCFVIVATRITSYFRPYVQKRGCHMAASWHSFSLYFYSALMLTGRNI